jgi:hypothetical protein
MRLKKKDIYMEIAAVSALGGLTTKLVMTPEWVPDIARTYYDN